MNNYRFEAVAEDELWVCFIDSETVKLSDVKKDSRTLGGRIFGEKITNNFI